jgi:hypothetical protein
MRGLAAVSTSPHHRITASPHHRITASRHRRVVTYSPFGFRWAEAASDRSTTAIKNSGMTPVGNSRKQ